jgi:hypothetical protein
MRLEAKQFQTITKRGGANKEYIGFLFVILALFLLPIERFEFFTGIRVVDFVLIPLVGYGILAAWLANQYIYLPLAWPMGLILIASLIATMGGVSYESGLMAILQEIYLFVWFIVITNFLILFSTTGVDTLTKVWTVVALIEATTTLMGMLQIGPSIFYTEPIGGYVISSSGVNRGLGTFVNPNATAAYLSISFFVLLATSWPKLLKAILGVWMFLGIFATGSMGATVSTVGGFLVLIFTFAFMCNPQTAKFWIGTLLIFVSIAIFIGLIFGPALLKFLENIAEAQWLVLTVGRLPASVMSRVILMQNCWGLYKHSPFGVGPSTCDLHNDYVAFLFERGPFGLIGWLWLIGTGLWTSWKTAWVQKKLLYRWQVLALGAAFLSIMVNSFSHEVFHFRQVWMLMAFLFASCTLLSISPGLATSTSFGEGTGVKKID